MSKPKSVAVPGRSSGYGVNLTISAYHVPYYMIAPLTALHVKSRICKIAAARLSQLKLQGVAVCAA